MDKQEKELLSLYFTKPFACGGKEVKSPYIAALIDSRISTGRDKKTGRKLSKSHGSWIGALGYMALLDHIGQIIEVKNVKRQEGNSFCRALYNFTELTEKEIYALYSLRCSFAHSYSLFNIPKKKDKHKDFKWHFFSVTQGSQGALAMFPEKKWDGDLKNDKYKTVINLELFCDLIESIHKTILISIDKDNINLLVPAEELLFIEYLK